MSHVVELEMVCFRGSEAEETRIMRRTKRMKGVYEVVLMAAPFVGVLSSIVCSHFHTKEMDKNQRKTLHWLL